MSQREPEGKTMKVILKRGTLVVVPQTDEEREHLAGWKAEQAGHVLYLQATSGEGLALFDLGAKDDACNEPVQVSSMVKDPVIQLLSNFAATPFELDGLEYASVESFWQGLKFEDRVERRRVAALPGKQARAAGQSREYTATVTYQGEVIPVGTWRHWALMERACQAKFTQHEEARLALLSTGTRPLVHRMRRDSKTIPGAIMAEIWMRIRKRLRHEVDRDEPDEE
jgi:predicted NAD-dependent protein-ADP-ribosyltransferase YbiA (DUF1768 family)